MPAIEFNGKTYERYRDGRWMHRNVFVHQGLQIQLNRKFSELTLIENLSKDELIAEANKLKNSSDYSAAARIYEAVIREWDEYTDVLNHCAAGLSSCYRNLNRPGDSISLYKKYWFVSNPAFLTSVAAAYMDLNDWDNAKVIAGKAYSYCNGRPDLELKLVYKRLDAAKN